MPFLNGVPAPRSLADVARGESVQVVDVVFGFVRQLCPSLDLHPGDTLDCEARTARDVILRGSDGQRMAVDLFCASFVVIRPVAPRALARPVDRTLAATLAS